jgi:hypothetical protein
LLMLRVTSISGALTAGSRERIFEGKASGVRNEYPPFGVNRATSYLSLGIGAKAKPGGKAARADR